MSFFDVSIDPKDKAELEATITKRLAERRRGSNDPAAEERRRIGDLLDYGQRAFENISYDLYNARKFVRMFPDEADASRGPWGWVKRLYQRVVRRVLRQQIVFNEATLGVLEELHERLNALERNRDVVEKSGKDS